MSRGKSTHTLRQRPSFGSRASSKVESKSSTVISAGLLEIFGLGVLILGHSGVGKSESSLELITRGHRLVADDVVQVEKTHSGKLKGRAPEVARNFMELRGLGLINIREIFGWRAICPSISIDLVIKLKRWQRGNEFDRIGLEFPEEYEILGVKIPQLIIPVAPGRNIATLIEIACKVHLLRKRGYLASQEIIQRMKRRMR